MPIYDIAGLKVEMAPHGGRTDKQAVPYLAADQSEGQHADIRINVDDKRVEEAMREHPELNQDDWKYMLTGSDFYTSVLKFDGILLHSSCIVVDGVAYAFSADRAHILNDDKPCIRKIDGKIYACGTPWSGKYDYSTPEVVPLGGICFLERSKTNFIKKADTKKAVYNIFSQTVRRLGAKDMEKLFDVIEDIFELVPLYELGCDISDEAVDTSYNAMKKDISEL